jgi:hypothetical protein
MTHLILSSHLHFFLTSDIILSEFGPKLCSCLSYFSTNFTYLAQLILLGLLTLIACDEDCKL